MRIYIVCKGNGQEYEDYDYKIVSAFTIRNNAKEYIKKEANQAGKYNNKKDFWIVSMKLKDMI